MNVAPTPAEWPYWRQEPGLEIRSPTIYYCAACESVEVKVFGPTERRAPAEDTDLHLFCQTLECGRKTIMSRAEQWRRRDALMDWWYANNAADPMGLCCGMDDCRGYCDMCGHYLCERAASPDRCRCRHGRANEG